MPFAAPQGLRGKTAQRTSGAERRSAKHTVEKYRAFWAGKSDPLSRSSVEFLALVGKEVQLLLSGRHLPSVLEIGCGNGSLFDFFGFAPERYRGVDFSPGMLGSFRAKHPAVDLVEAEGSSYEDARRYDLVFSHDVIQHFTRDMLDDHFANARKMMHSNSLLVCASVPWRELRPSYDWGLWFNGGTRNLVQWSKNRVRRILGRDIMGHWYRTSEIVLLAKKHSLSVRFHGSIAYPYRFHAVLAPRGGS
jgi:SAM-dependent methyltransferase